MKRIAAFLLVAALASGSLTRAADSRLEDAFVHPPEDARPWVFWFWSDGNITREGITADLEAMQRVGIGGVLIMEVDQSVPPGPVRFMSAAWRELFAFAAAEAGRLGLKINLNNDAGWNGSGGPWVTPEQSMQKVVWKETRVTGPRRFDASLEQPETVEGFYRDIAVLAYPAPAGDQRLEKFAPKSGLGMIASDESPPALAPTALIRRERVLDLTSQFKNGNGAWDVPAGEWTIVRFGHTSTGKNNYPAPAEGRGLDVDKLSRAPFDAHYDAFVGKIIPGAPAVSTIHIDSWEVGYQNWTPAFRAEFQKRRGYDPLPWFPVVSGRAVESVELSERFFWDMRRTISELVNDNYATRMAERAHASGRQFSLEGYSNGPFDCLTYTARADIPVGEFWTTKDPAQLHASVKTMTSAGHIFGKNLIGAEAFTANDANGRQRHHPYSLKAIGDAAFCAGINQFIFHRYSLQPWIDDRKPGMTMGPWGVEYERTATWWEQTKPWHEYLARCQHLLRQGRFVGDLCYLQSEEGFKNPLAPSQLKPAVPEGYDFDFCSDEVVLTRMTVRDGRLTLPDGMSYRALVLPEQRLMTPRLLRKITELVRAGATVVGPPPRHAPGLTDYPRCDDELKQLVGELWPNAGASPAPQSFTKGKVLWGPTLTEVLAHAGAAPDFAYRQIEPAASDARLIRFIHRTLPDRELYFVANLAEAPARVVASFRVDGRAPELWHPDTGVIEPSPAYESADGRVRVPLEFDPRGSVFVVFRRDRPVRADRLIAIAKDGAPILDTEPVPLTAAPAAPKRFDDVTGTFTFAGWVKPAADTVLPKQSASGTGTNTLARNDVLYPPPGHEVFGGNEAVGAGLAVGRNGVTVLEHGQSHFVATLVYPVALNDWTHVAVVFESGTPRLYLNGELVGTGLKTAHTVHGGVGVPHTREPAAFKGDHSALRQFNRALSTAEIRDLMRTMPKTPVVAPSTPPAAPVALAALQFDARGKGWVTASGRYEITRAGGAPRTMLVGQLPAAVSVTGSWRLAFPAGWGAPAQVELPKLISWTEHPESGVRYFSGTATYATAVDVPADFLRSRQRTWLDLGNVAVIAEVKLNGRPLGTLWKPPFAVDVTDVLKPGRNDLEVRVTNLWVNRLIGDEQLPLDREWTKVPRRNGWALKAYPDWLQRGERSPVGRVTFATWKHYEKDAPLLPSGLLGPVVLRPAVELTVDGRN